MTFALGIDLGGSSVKAVAVTPDGRLLGDTNDSFDVQAQFDWAQRVRPERPSFVSPGQSPGFAFANLLQP